MPKLSKSIRDLITYILSGGLVRLLPLLILPYVARVLSEADFGYFSLYRLYTVLGTTLVLLGIEQALFRLIPGKPEKDKNTFTGSAFYFVFLFGLLLCAIYMLFADFLQDFLFQSGFSFPAVYLPMMLVFSAITSIILTRHSADKNSLLFLRSNVLRHGSFFLVLVIGLFLDYGLQALFAAFFISESLLYLYSYKLIYRALKNGIQLSALKVMLRLGLPLMGVMLTTLMLYQSDHYLIKFFISVEKTGVYNYGYKFAAVISIFVLLSNNVWMPRLYEKGESFIHDHLKDYSTIIVLACQAILFVLLILFSEFEQWLLPPGFTEAFMVLAVSGVGYLFYAHAQLLDGWLILDKKTGLLFGVSLGGLVINIILNIIFIPRFGIIAAAAITSISFFLIWLTLVIYLARTKTDFRFKPFLLEFTAAVIPALLYLSNGRLYFCLAIFLVNAVILLLRNGLLQSFIGDFSGRTG